MVKASTLVGATFGTVGALADIGSGMAIPGMSVVKSLAEGIREALEQASVNQDSCSALASKCNIVLQIVDGAAPTIKNDQFRGGLDNLEFILKKIYSDISTWSHKSLGTFLIKRNTIETKLTHFTAELDAVLNQFTATAAITSQTGIEENKSRIEYNTYQIDDLKAMMYDLQVGTRQNKDLLQDIMNKMIVERMEPTAPAKQMNNGLSPGVAIQSQQRLKELDELRRLMQELEDHVRSTEVKVLDGLVTREELVAETGRSEVWRGKYGGRDVALKTYTRLKGSGQNDLIKACFVRELRIWNDLFDEHITRLYGITCDFGNTIHIISAFQPNKDVRTRLSDYKTGARPDDFDRAKIMRGAAQGLQYLHSRNLVHGNLNCAKILITATGEAQLCDFGMARFLEELPDSAVEYTQDVPARFLTPELARCGGIPDFSTDVWQFATSLLHCFSNEKPYHDIKRTGDVWCKLIDKEHPSRPSSELSRKWITDDVWALLVRCWSPEPTDRPSMAQVRQDIFKIEESINMSSFSVC